MPRIAWIEDRDARGQLAECYNALKAMNPFGDGKVPDVFRAMSQRPEFLAGVMSILPVQFADGHLTRAQHEMIASYVSVINHCHFWLSAHAHFLRSQGTEFEAAAAALREGNLDALPVSNAEKKLLAMIDTLTRCAYRIDDRMIEDLRQSGWTDPQIAEAVYIGSFFNMMVRIADAFHAMPPPVTDASGVPAAITSHT